MSTATTRAPSARSCSAMARPIPCAAPVTTAALSPNQSTRPDASGMLAAATPRSAARSSGRGRAPAPSAGGLRGLPPRTARRSSPGDGVARSPAAACPPSPRRPHARRGRRGSRSARPSTAAARAPRSPRAGAAARWRASSWAPARSGACRGPRRARGGRGRPRAPHRWPGQRRRRHLRGAVRDLRRDHRHAGQRRASRPVLGDLLYQRVDHGPLGVGPEDHLVRGDHRDRLLLQGDDRVGWRRGRRTRGQPGRRDRLPGCLCVQLRVHPDPAGHPPRDPGHPMTIARDWIASFGEIAKFAGKILGNIFGLRVFRFFGEALRQSGILILSSTIVIWGLVFIIGLQCGIEGAYFNRAVGAPAYAGVFSAWCDLRELVPYAFGYMMAAKVGTGIVAELGSMRISDEIDALEVMGIDSVLFLCSTRLLAAWMVLPFMYIAAVGAGFFASYLAVVQQIGEVSSGGFFLIFWMFQNPPDLLY